MRLLLVNEHIYGQVSGEETFWSVLGKALPGAETLALSTFSGDVKEYVQKYDPDVIIYNSLLGNLDVPAKTKKIVLLQDNFIAMDHLLPKTFKQKVGRFFRGKNSFFKKTVQKQREAIRNAHRVVCVSEDIKRSYGVEAKVIPIGVDPELFHPIDKTTIRKKYTIPDHQNVKIFVGSTHLVKGFDILLEEIKNNPKTFYIIVLKDAELPIINFSNVKIFNRVSQRQLAELYSCADVFIGCSRVETLWLAPIEAMFCGVPVDVTPAGIFADWRPDNKQPRQEAFEKGLDKASMVKKWQELLAELF